MKKTKQHGGGRKKKKRKMHITNQEIGKKAKRKQGQ